REVVCDGVTGKLVSVGDVDGFVDALKSFFDASVRKRFSNAGPQHIKDNFSIENINKKTLSLYLQLWNNRRK
ncbi:MAG: N-acetyl-alpha-D-glucosaminyl L-malate synthase BshA, partial [Candidatus Omnitrophota bacterium]